MNGQENFGADIRPRAQADRPATAPAVRPCGSCPYRRDVPSGIWSPEEYEKLPEYDAPTWQQPPAMFLCHQQNGRLCAGWVGCHDMMQNLGLRLASAAGRVSEDDLDTILDYSTDVALFATGAEAAEHGLAEVEAPSFSAVRQIQKLEQRRSEPSP